MGFFTPEHLAEVRAKSDAKAEKHLAQVFGPDLGPAMYRACVDTWGCGPAVATARLSDRADQILAAWKIRDELAGLVLRKEGMSFIPIYLTSELLAYNLCRKCDLWISFRAVKKELKQ